MNTPHNTLFELKDFTFRYGNEGPFALKNINFSIFEGEILLIGGISGSGKSTLCNTISGQIPFSIRGQMKGTCTVFGKDIKEQEHSKISKQISYVFQNAEEQLITYTVYDEIAFAAENYCVPQGKIKDRISSISESLGITHLLNRSIHQLSGGEKQKVILASNLITKPKILILDEPLAFLDEDGKDHLILLLEKIHKTNPKMAIIIVEHRYKPFSPLISRLLLLTKHGEILFSGEPNAYPQEILDAKDFPLRDFTRSLGNPEIINNNKKNYKNSEFKPLISIKNVSFMYPGTEEGKEQIKNITLNINHGEFLGIRGKNGSGKTTLLYLISKIIAPSNGQIKLNEKDIFSIKDSKFLPNIGFIFQNPENQIFEKSIEDEILYGPRNFKDLSNIEIDNDIKNMNGLYNIDSLIELIGEKRMEPDELKKCNPFCLSWGQKRRLNLSSIFSYSPDLLLIDEPFIGQDVRSIEKIMKILQKYHDDNKTIIIVSHDKNLLEKYCSRIVEISSLSDNTKDKAQTSTHETEKERESKKVKKVNQLFREQFITNISPNEISKVGSLNPIVKLILLVLFTGYLFQERYLILFFSMFGLILLTSKLLKLPIKQFLRRLRLIVMLTLIYVPLNTIFEANISSDDVILFYLFDTIPIYTKALYYSTRTGILIICLFSSAILFTRTTSLKDLQYALMQMGVPYRYAFSFIIGIRYIPLIENESDTIKIAQRLRGESVSKKSNPKKAFQYIFHRLSTLLISILRKTKNTSVSLESRGFGDSKKRTNLYHVSWKKLDIFILLVVSAAIILFALMINGVFFSIDIPSLLY